MSSKRTAEQRALVVGGGPAGLAAAVALAHCNIDTCVLAPPHRPLGERADSRTAALFAGSIAMLRNLGVWPDCGSASAAITAIRIVDETGGWPRAPEVLFAAADAGLDAFGYNVPNTVLVEALLAKARANPAIELIDTAGAVKLETGPEAVVATTREGRTPSGRLAVAADGRNSMCREAAGIATRRWAYEQAAVTTQFEHGRAHDGVSTELHRRSGPLTVVPMPGRKSSLVWVERPDTAQRLAGIDDDAFRAELEARLGGLLGRIGAIGARSVFPLAGLTALTMGQNRVALVGEAGHVIPPIGAQGLNLGLRDAATIAELAGDAASAGQDAGGDEVTRIYGQRRSADVTARSWTVDLLNRSLLTSLLPVHLMRGVGLAALKSIGPLRRMAVREGLQPSSQLPRMMREEAPTMVGGRSAT